jgi:hypothetical protein
MVDGSTHAPCQPMGAENGVVTVIGPSFGQVATLLAITPGGSTHAAGSH